LSGGGADGTRRHFPCRSGDGNRHSGTPRLAWYEMTRSSTPAAWAASMNTAIMTALSFPLDS
jgi:hypothetical protein